MSVLNSSLASIARVQTSASFMTKGVMVLTTANKVKMKSTVVWSPRLGVTWM